MLPTIQRTLLTQPEKRTHCIALLSQYFAIALAIHRAVHPVSSILSSPMRQKMAVCRRDDVCGPLQEDGMDSSFDTRAGVLEIA